MDSNTLFNIIQILSTINYEQFIDLYFNMVGSFRNYGDSKIGGKYI